MANQQNLTDDQRKLRLCLYICGALGTVFGALWWLEITNVLVARLLASVFLLATLLLYARISDLNMRRAKDRKSQTEAAKGSSG